MPRELIRGASEPFNVKVGWHHEVQIGVEADQQRSLAWILYGGGPDALAKLGEQVRRLSLVEYEDDEHLGRAVLNTLDCLPAQPFYGVWSDLDRYGCNRLIRTLRKARDAAFGRDE